MCLHDHLFFPAFNTGKYGNKSGQLCKTLVTGGEVATRGKHARVRMFVMCSISFGISINMIHGAEGYVVPLETATEEVYRYKGFEVEDNIGGTGRFNSIINHSVNVLFQVRTISMEDSMTDEMPRG